MEVHRKSLDSVELVVVEGRVDSADWQEIEKILGSSSCWLRTLSIHETRSLETSQGQGGFLKKQAHITSNH